jgi:hypothetical protein
MSNVPRIRDFPSEWAAIKRRVKTLETASRLRSASIGEGGLTVRDGGSVTIKDPGDLILETSTGEVLWRASEDPVKTTWANQSVSGLSTIPATWTVMGWARRPVPDFFTTGHFLVMVSVGDTMSGASQGSVSVQPLFRFVRKDGTMSGWFSGPAIASAENRITVAQSFWGSDFGLGTSNTVSHVDFGVNAVRSFGTELPGNGNWHVSASVIYKRGEVSAT